MILLAPFIPTLCCTAPDMPNAMYRSGFTMRPDMPTWRDLGIHPFSTRAREQHSAAPIFPHTRSATSMTDLSRMPSPREMTILASPMSSPPFSTGESRNPSGTESPVYCQ